MSTTDTPRFTSGLAPALTGLVAEKRGVGYDYAATAADLQQLDRFCRATGHQTLTLPRDLVAAFIAKRPHETETNRHHRQTLVRLVGEYLQRHGVPAYVLPRGGQGPTPAPYVPHIFTRAELRAFFQAVDTLSREPAAPHRHQVYPVLFRLLYGSGLRVSEAVGLRGQDVDTTAGWVHIRAGKFGKERRVPLHPALTARCQGYVATVLGTIPPDASFLPAPHGGPYTPGTVYTAFRQLLWTAGISHGGRGHGPRLHDLRHTFAVHCLRRWVEDGTDLSVALPYLSAYLGHTGLRGTQDYLRLTAELYPTLATQLTRQFGGCIPEVTP